jgi:ligand-binding sensor domain-containing protein
MRDGLPHDRVDALLETSEGRFLAGTTRGLSSYVPEADRFESYTKTQGLSDAGIKPLAEDREGNLWVGTEAGGVMKIACRGFTLYTEADGSNNTRIASIIVDRAGELCAATSPTAGKWSLDCFNGKRFRSIRPNYPATMHYLGWGWNQTAFQDHTGGWWIPTGEGLSFRKDDPCRTTRGVSPESGIYHPGRLTPKRRLSPV